MGGVREQGAEVRNGGQLEKNCIMRSSRIIMLHKMLLE
jgi:hypothetical protein